MRKLPILVALVAACPALAQQPPLPGGAESFGCEANPTGDPLGGGEVDP